jgi:hypothetical protein
MAGGVKATEWVPVEEAALALGTTQARVLRMLRSKEILGEEEAGSWRIARPSLLFAKAHGVDRKAAAGCAACRAARCGSG